MKNYTYGWHLKAQGYKEVPESEYSEHMIDMKKFIDKLSDVVREANCGWSKVAYKVMKYAGDSIAPFMVLYAGEHDARWIPIDGNSKGCNLEVLGENLW
jgi:hypothetical protein